MKPIFLSFAPKLTIKAAKRLVMAMSETASKMLIAVYRFNSQAQKKALL